MLILKSTQFGKVEGLGDEEIPWWIAPYRTRFSSPGKKLGTD